MLRMKRKWKQVCSMILTFAVLVGGMTGFAPTASAQESTSVSKNDIAVKASALVDTSTEIAGQSPLSLEGTDIYNGLRGESFNKDWVFHEGDVTNGGAVSFDDSQWQDVTLPHDFSIYHDFDPASPAGGDGAYLTGGVGWYRKTFTVPEEDRGKQIFVNFDGAYALAKVWINGEYIAYRPNGYQAFQCDLTDYLNYGGENVIAVRVHKNDKDARWYTGAGINRNVWLTTLDPVHVDYCGMYVTTPGINYNTAPIDVETTVVNESREVKDVQLVTSVLYENGGLVEKVTSESTEVAANSDQVIKSPEIRLNNYIPWDVNAPYLYMVRTEVLVDGQVVDTYETTLGLRTITFDAEKGFFLNGNNIKFEGVCLHSDWGSLGSQANYRAMERELQIMKEMGVNAVRFCHNFPDAELLELCDRLGLMVYDESYDVWRGSKNGSKDYSLFFNKKIVETDGIKGTALADDYDPNMTWAELDVKDWIKRDRNHPSVIMWGIGNEIAAYAEMVEDAKNLYSWVKTMDPASVDFKAGVESSARPVTWGNNQNDNTLKQQVSALMDIDGINYQDRKDQMGGSEYGDGTYGYEKFHNRNPEQPMFAAETCSNVKSRGIYKLPINNWQGGVGYDDNQCSSYESGNWLPWAKESVARINSLDYMMGEFVWTGFDYLGEPSPYAYGYKGRSSYFGIVDTAGFPKDIYYYYQSVWNPDVDVLHILPHWNWNTGNNGVYGDALPASQNGIVPVFVYTNCVSVELFLNGKSQGIRTTGEGELGTVVDGDANHLSAGTSSKDAKWEMRWDVPYEKGTLMAVGTKADGTQIVEQIKTSGEPAAVKMKADRTAVDADGKDLIYVEVDITDENGLTVPTATNRVTFSLSGPGVIVGVDNGDASYKEHSLKSDNIPAFSGKCLVIVKALESSGTITVTAASDGLDSDSVTVKSVPVESSVTMDLSGVTLDPDKAILIGTMEGMEYSVNSVDGTDGDWKAAQNSVTSLPFESKAAVYVREAANHDNYRRVGILADFSGDIGGGETVVATLTAAADGSVNAWHWDDSENEKKANFGGDPVLRTQKNSSYGVFGEAIGENDIQKDAKISYLQFDLAGLSGQNWTKAEFVLTYLGAMSKKTDTDSVQVVKTAGEWTEGTGLYADRRTPASDGSLTWNTKPAIMGNPLTSESFSVGTITYNNNNADRSNGITGTKVTVDITSLVKEALAANETVLSLAFCNSVHGQELAFVSKEGSTYFANAKEDMAPTLIIKADTGEEPGSRILESLSVKAVNTLPETKPVITVDGEPGDGNTLYYVSSVRAINPPKYGENITSIQHVNEITDTPVDVQRGYYIGVYKADAEGKIIGFGQTIFTLKEKDIQVFESGFAEAVNKTYGDAGYGRKAELTVGEGAVTYTSSNKDVATVDDNGNVTLVGAGSTIIRAAAAETDTYKEGQISYTLTVAKKELVVAPSNYNIDQGDPMPELQLEYKGLIDADAGKGEEIVKLSGGTLELAIVNSRDETITDSGVPGFYTIQFAGNPVFAESPNYMISTINGIFAIREKSVPVQTFAVMFYSEDGAKIPMQTIEAGKTVTEPAELTRNGYHFEGWLLNGEKFDFDTPVTENMVLAAKWVKIRYSVTFNSNEGSAVAEQLVDQNGKAVRPGSPVRSGYTFKGWYTDEALTKVYDFNTLVTADITLYAKWEENTKYTVAFDTVGGTEIQTQTVELGKTAEKPVNPTKDGYTFDGWMLDGERFDFSTPVTGDIMLAAKWVRIQYDVFKDVTSDDWFYDAVYYLYNKGIMTGYTPDTFHPYGVLARAQFAVTLYRMNGEEEVEYTDKFPDVAADTWYTNAILWASAKGVVTGYGEAAGDRAGYFGPADNIQRQQMAVMLYRYAEFMKYDTDETISFEKYLDADKVDDYAKEAMAWAVGSGIISGKEEQTMLDPAGNTTRAECAVMLQRFMEKYE